MNSWVHELWRAWVMHEWMSCNRDNINDDADVDNDDDVDDDDYEYDFY